MRKDGINGSLNIFNLQMLFIANLNIEIIFIKSSKMYNYMSYMCPLHTRIAQHIEKYFKVLLSGFNKLQTFQFFIGLLSMRNIL